MYEQFLEMLLARGVASDDLDAALEELERIALMATAR